MLHLAGGDMDAACCCGDWRHVAAVDTLTVCSPDLARQCENVYTALARQLVGFSFVITAAFTWPV